MKAGKVIAVITAVVLLLPGLCVTAVSFQAFQGTNGQVPGLIALMVGLGILALAARLFWIGIRRTQPAPQPSRRPDERSE
jgi:hypothetical protein